MLIPLILLKHVARAYLNHLSGGLAGELVFGVADEVMKAWQRDGDEQARRAELEILAQAATVEVKDAVAEAVSQVAPDRTDEERRSLSAYLTQVPASIRRTLRRPTDPTGRTVPQGLAVRTAYDLVPLLPSRLPRFQPGDRPLAGVDRELVELLGVGGFGEVWKAVNPNRPSVTPVALKFCLDDAAKDRLLRHEARMLDRVMRVGAHPGIVALRDTYLNAEPPCLEYEFVGGGELTAVILEYGARGGMSPRGAARIVERLAKTVGYFHRLDPPIVHRDLKPANVLVTKDAEGRIGLKVADFGIGGIAAGREIERANTGVSRGEPNGSIARGSYTPLYASPEQVRGAAPDPRDDVHALGVVWFQLLTGDLSNGAPTGLDWIEDLTEKGMTREQIGLLASCFSSRQERRPRDAAVLAAKIDTLFGLREKRSHAPAPGAAAEAYQPESPTPPSEHGLSVRISETNELGQISGLSTVGAAEVVSAGSTHQVSPADESGQGEGGQVGDFKEGNTHPADGSDSDAITEQGVSLDTWDAVRRFVGFDKASGSVLEDLLKEAVGGLGVRNTDDPALSVNWRGRQALSFTYGDAEVLNVEQRDGWFEVWVVVPESEAGLIGLGRRSSDLTFFSGDQTVRLVHLKTRRSLELTDAEREYWARGLSLVAVVSKGRTNPRRGHSTYLSGTWLHKLCEFEDRSEASAPDNSTNGPTGAANEDVDPSGVSINSVGMQFALIPCGPFLMGDKASWIPDIQPLHVVTVSKPFFLAIHPVSRGEYREVMGKSYNRAKGKDSEPLTKVSWFDAVQFCNSLILQRQVVPA